MSTLPPHNAVVHILTRTATTDSHGRPKESWSVSAWRVRCYIQQNTGRESVMMGAERQVRTGTADFDTTPTISASQRIRWGTRTLEIKAVNPVSRDPALVDFQRVEWEEISGAA